MYILIGIIFAICILFFMINFYRRKCIIRKICSMNFCEKLYLLNDLAAPFGFYYVPEQDIITSRTDAWQKEFGYCRLFDTSASGFNMIFDCEPVYFEYDDHTWMIEFWKGQYGINIGGEIGIYEADSLLLPEQYDRTLFHSISDHELFPISMELNFKGQPLFSISRKHWWLTGFYVGNYCEPEDLSMDISITFPNEEMLLCFVESLERLGYEPCELCVCGRTVSFLFSTAHTWQPRLISFWRARFSQWQNRIFSKLYRLITIPFTCTMDRILYLYFFLPVAFRHLLCFKRNRKQKFHKENKKLSCKNCNHNSRKKCNFNHDRKCGKRP